MGKFCTITLELYDNGMHFICDDADMDELIPQGDGNKLMELLNEASLRTDPDTTYSLTEKGKVFSEWWKEHKDLTFDNAILEFDKVYKEDA